MCVCVCDTRTVRMEKICMNMFACNIENKIRNSNEIHCLCHHISHEPMTENKWSIWHEIQLQFRTAAFTPFFCCVTHSQPKLTLITEMGLPFLKRKPVRCYHLRFIRHLFMYHMHMGVSRISVWRGIMMIFSKNWGTFSEKKTVRSWVRINWKWRAEKRPPCPVGRFKSVLSHKSMK